MKTEKEPVKAKAKAVKERVKAKAKAVKERVKAKAKAVKGKAKGVKAGVAAMAAVLGATAFFGCSTAQPASRSTTASYSIEISFDDSARSNTASVRLGDGAIASADSSGSTETQTATPTTTIDVKPDIRYNDAIAGATSASRGVLSAIGYGSDAVLEMMAGKKSGTVKVQRTDGTDATVKCESGQCSFCEDCTAK